MTIGFIPGYLRLRKLLFLVLLFMGMPRLYAQDVEQCEKIVNIAVEAVNTRSADELKKYLAEGFVCAGQTGETAVKVLEILVGQLDEVVTETSKLSEQWEDGRLTMLYDFNYSRKLGHKTVTFVFNADNRLEQLDLITARVKVVDAKNVFDIPEDDIIAIPFEICNNLPVVNAEVDGIPRKFIVDTGAPTLYLNSKYFACPDSSVISMSNSRGVVNTAVQQNVARVASFDFYGIRVQDNEFVMSDLSHLLKEEEIYGLIGYAVLKDYDWLFDYENSTLTLIKPEKTAAYLKQTQGQTVEVPLQLVPGSYHIPYVKGGVNGREVSLGIDSGATGNLMDISLWEFMKDSLADISTTELVGLSQDAVDVHEGTITALQIGDKMFDNLITVFNDMSHINARLKKGLDGLLGYEILSKQKTLISVSSGKMIFIE